MIGQRYPGIAGMREDEYPRTRPHPTPLYRIEYEYQGRVWATVVEAESIEDAKRIFRRDHPRLEIREISGD